MHSSRIDLAQAAAAGTLALLLSASMTACSPDGGNARTAAAEASGDGLLKFGLLLDAAGGESELDRAQQAAVELGIAEINAAGGLKGRQVELLPVVDEAAAAAAQAYIDGGADVVIGPTDSANAPEAIDVLSAARVAVISPANGAAALSDYDSDGYYFRTYPSDIMQGYALAEELQAAGRRNVVILVEDSSYGTAVSTAVQEALTAAGTGSALISTADGIPAAVASAEAAGPDAVVVIARASAQAVLGQLANSGIDPATLYLSSGATDRYGSALAVGALEGAHGVLPGTIPPVAFQSRVLEIDPQLDHLTFAPQAYDAVLLAALAAASAQDDAGTSIAANLLTVSGNGAALPESSGTACESFSDCMDLIEDGEPLDYQGVSGPILFDAHGDVSAARFSWYEYDRDNTPAHLSEQLVTVPQDA